MKYYESIFIFKPNLGEEKYNDLIKKFESWITDNDGKIISLNRVGQRELAQPFNKFNQGYVTECIFGATNKTLEAVNQNFKVTEDRLRHLTVKLDEIMTQEKIDAVVAGAA